MVIFKTNFMIKRLKELEALIILMKTSRRVFFYSHLVIKISIHKHNMIDIDTIKSLMPYLVLENCDKQNIKEK